MFEINKKDYSIKMTRGNTASFNLILDNYTIQSTDTVVFTIKKRVSDFNIVLQITADMGVFLFNPEDTQYLDVGNYVYDIHITTSQGAEYTPIQSSFTLVQGVTE